MPKLWTENELKIALDTRLTGQQAAALLEHRSPDAVYQLRWKRRVKTDRDVMFPDAWNEHELKIVVDTSMTAGQAAELLGTRTVVAVRSKRKKLGVKIDYEAIRLRCALASETGNRKRKKPKQAKPAQIRKVKQERAPKTAPVHAPPNPWSSVFSADDRLLGPYHPSQHLRIEKYRAKVRREPENVSFDVHTVRATPKTAKAGSVRSTRPAL